MLVWPDSVRRHLGRAFSLVEVLVVVAIVGVLVALLLPAVQAARESARRMTCVTNLKQIGLGLHQFHDARKRFPPGMADYDWHSHCWMTFILPYVEQQALYERYRFDLHWNEDTNRDVVFVDLSIQLCPTSEHKNIGQGDYGGINGPGNYPGIADGTRRGQAYELGVFPCTGNHPDTRGNRAVSIAGILDGTSYTMAVGEDAGRTDSGRYWAYGEQTFAHHKRINGTRPNELFSDHAGGVHILLADGSARFLSETTTKQILDYLATRAKGEIFDRDSME